MNFVIEESSTDTIMKELTDFLNARNISEFVVVQMEKEYLEIVYKIGEEE